MHTLLLIVLLFKSFYDGSNERNDQGLTFGCSEYFMFVLDNGHDNGISVYMMVQLWLQG